MKKIILLLCALIFSSYVNAADIVNSDQIITDKYKSIPKQEWEEYQKYKEEQENNVFISEEEYEEYKQYKKKISNKEQKENSINFTKKSANEDKYISNSLFVGFDKTLHYDLNVKFNGASGSESKGDGWGVTLEFGHREDGIMLGAGINMNNVDSSTFTNIYPYINFIIPLSDKNKDTVVNLFLGGAIGYGHYSEKSNIYDIEISAKGTLFWRLLCGIDINNLMFFINYSTNYMNIEAYSSYYGTKISGSATYEKLSIGIGYRFIL